MKAKKTTAKKEQQPEYTAQELTKYAIQLLTIKGFKVWKNTSSGMVAGGRFVTVAKGVPDIIGFRKQDALFVGVEVKTKRDRLSEHQEAFRDELEQAGGIWVELRQPEDLEKKVA